MRSDPQKRFEHIMQEPAKYRVQILVTEIASSKSGACLRSHGYRLNAEYFYPASAIKIVGAVAVLFWLQEQRKVHPTLSIDVPLSVLAGNVKLESGSVVTVAGESQSKTIREVLEQTLVYSSNPGFNWLYDVAGPDLLQRPFWRAGFQSVRVRHRLADRAFPREALACGIPIGSGAPPIGGSSLS
jgi:hypothetical protein